jgi:hypothetical protein
MTAQGSGVRLYGLTLEIDFPFAASLPPAPEGAAGGPPDVRLTREDELPAGDLPPALFASALGSAAVPGEPALTVYRLAAGDLLHFPGVADFILDPAAGRIACRLASPTALPAAEAWFLGTVLAWWLERTGIPAFHASAVALAGRAVGFLAFSRTGKSTLAASLLDPAAVPTAALLTDDVLAVEDLGDGSFAARPSYPQMRLWPAAAERFVAEVEELPRVHPEIDKRRLIAGVAGATGVEGFAFQAEACPLVRIYLPERRQERPEDKAVRLETVRPRDAVIELVRHSFLPRLTAVAGLQEHRLGLFTRLAGQVPVRRLSYPSGFEHLPAVRAALLADLESG